MKVTVLLCLLAVPVIAARGIAGAAQISQETERADAVVDHSANMTLSIRVLKQHDQVGEEPWVILTVENSGHSTIGLRYFHVHVEGEHGEPPTTLYQRQITHRQNPGEPELSDSMFAGPYVEPGASGVRRFNLSLLYDLSKPGKYKVYVDMLDELASQRTAVWVRSSTAQFEILASH